MNTLEQVHEIVEQEIARLNWEREPIGLYAPIEYTLALGGKRIRPALVLLATDMFDGDLKHSMPAALAVEVFHNFTLLHDDVMDKADVRRGKPTVHKKWNENTAILSGDQMLIEAYKLLVETESSQLKAVHHLFSTMASEVCEGQQYDMDFEQRTDVTIDEYIKMIRLKTAVLLGTALKMGALISDASHEDQEALYDFGINLGLAFQLKDDYLDVYGDEKTFGKAIGGDIMCNKKTYLLITALQEAKSGAKQELEYLLKGNNYNASEKIAAVTDIYNRLGVNQTCDRAIAHYNNLAMESLERLSVADERKEALRALAAKLMKRKD